MFNTRMFNFYNSLVILITLYEFSVCQNVPFVNCPKIFQYKFDGSEWFGVIDLKDIAPGLAFKLTVDMALSENIPQIYLGSLDLKINRKETVEYKIKFPLPAALPKLAEIRFNENIICSSTFGDGIPTTTVLVLEQTASGHISFDTDIQGVQNQIIRNVNDNNGSPRFKNEESRFMNESKKSASCGHLAGKFGEYPVDYSIGEFERGTWPWLAAIFHRMEYQCVGTLISNRAILTTASCLRRDFDPIQHDMFGAFLGAHNFSNIQEEGVVYVRPSRIHIHPDFQETSSNANIAIMVLVNEVHFSDYIRPACIWSESTSLEKIIGENGYFAGWGVDATGNYPQTPSRADTFIVSHAKCLRSQESFSVTTSERTFCAGDRNGQGPCTGDYGAGLFMRRGSQWILRGMVSVILVDTKTRSCDLANYVVYTDVAFFTEWIKENSE